MIGQGPCESLSEMHAVDAGVVLGLDVKAETLLNACGSYICAGLETTRQRSRLIFILG
jgi:hypothetical protein